jgi:hypothetical protein
MTGTISASTTRVRTFSEPRTPILTTHWNAKFHFHISIISLLRPALRRHTSLSTPPSTVRISLIRADDVVRYARWLSELMSGRVDVQSRARRSYKAVVMPTDALLTLGILKLTSLILESVRTIAVMKEVLFVDQVFRPSANTIDIFMTKQADAACSNARCMTRC